MGHNPFDIVKDSSIWVNPHQHAAINSRDPMLRLGIVKRVYNDDTTKELRYLVEVRNQTDQIEVNCVMLRRFGGVYNYEDYIFHGYSINDKPDPVTAFDAKAGDIVLIGQLNGQGREGVIIGGLTHPARQTVIKASDGPQYKSEFNGIETVINKDGEMTVTFKGVPTNIARLNNTPSSKLPNPTYNTAVGSSFYKFDKTGSWTISDAALTKPQTLKIDKPNGTVTISAGDTILKFTKSSETVDMTAKFANFNIATKMTVITTECLISASQRAYIKTDKVAIGKSGIELLDQLAQLVDKLGAVTPISPVGPCTPLKATGAWSGVEAVKSKIKEITGSF